MLKEPQSINSAFAKQFALRVTYRHRLESVLEFSLHAMFCQPFSKISQKKAFLNILATLKMVVNDVNCLLHVKMLENDAKYFKSKKPPKLASKL